MSGTSTTVTVQATVRNVNDFSGQAVYVYIVDSKQILQGTPNIQTLAQNKYSVSLNLSALLAAGSYSGDLLVQLCKDSQCAAQFPGSPVKLPYRITVTAYVAPLTAVPAVPLDPTPSMHLGGSVPAAATVSVGGENLTWTATTSTSWLNISQGSGVGPGQFTISYAAAGLPLGTHQGLVTVASRDGQKVDLPVTLEVLPTQFELTSGIPSFSAVNGAPIPSQVLTFELDNRVSTAWSASSAAAWLQASPLSGTTPGQITLAPDPALGPLASGAYSADLVLSAAGFPSKTVTASLNLTRATLASSVNAVSFGGPKGRTFTPQSLTMTLDTGAKAWGWSLAGLPSGVQASALSGQVDGSGSTLSFTPDLAALTPGSSSAAVTVTSHVNGDTLTLPLTININADQHKLLASDYGVGLTSTPGVAVLTRTLQISDNYGGNVAWTATSDAAWLSVTTSGSTGAATALSLSAAPAGLANETLSYATVTIRSAQAGVDPVHVRVALWKSASDAAAVSATQGYTMVVADRLRPYAYVHSGGNSIDIFHTQTGQKIGSIPAVGAALGAMAVSPDGSLLYVLDTANRSMAVVDLDRSQLSQTWSLDAAVTINSLVAVRPNNVEIVLVGDGSAYSTGHSLGTTGIAGILSATVDGSHVAAQDDGTSPTSVREFEVDYSAISGGVLMVHPQASTAGLNGSGNGADIAVNRDGSRIYTASGYPYTCSVADGADLSLIGSLPGGDAYPNNVEITADGRVICGIMGWYSPADFWVHSASGALIKGYKVAGYARALLRRQMVVSADGTVVVTLTDDPLLAFVPIGP